MPLTGSLAPSRRVASRLAILALLLAVPADAAPLFRAPFRGYSPLGAGTNCVALGDFNGDGALDVAVGSNGTNSIAILLNTGHGEFQPPAYLPSLDYARTIVISDLNADGYLDLVVGYRFASSVSVFLGLGDGLSYDRSDYASGREPRSVAIGDVDRDGHLDLVVANSEAFYGRSVTVLRGNGDGTFQPKIDSPTDGISPSTVGLADFNADGLLDVVVGYEGGATFVYVMLGLGGGRLGPINGRASGYNPITVDAGDVDGDTRPDFIVGGAWSGDVSVHYGLGLGQFENRVSIPIPGSAVVRLADVDRDGIPDILTPAAVMRGRGHRAFDAPASFLTDRDAAFAAAGDLDGDGRSDLVTAHPYPGTIAVLTGLGDGTFGGQRPFATALNPAGLAAGDVDHDGRVDVAAASYNGHAVSIHFGAGDGSFTHRTEVAGDFYPHDAAFVDLDRDGSLDLVTQNFGGTVSTLLGAGDGSFGPRRDFGVRAGAQWLATGDFNRDGFPDVVAANFGTSATTRPYGFLPDSTVTVLFGAGDGTLANRTDLVAGLAPLDVEVADMNRDGNDDIVVANPGSVTVAVLLGNGDGSFRPPREFAAGPYPNSLVLGDFDSDGATDVAVAGGSSGVVTVLPGNGDGSLRAGTNIPEPGTLRWIGAGDWNGDGRTDLATMRESGNTVHLLLNQGSGRFEPADFYGTGTGPEHGLVTDLNGDKQADIVSADFFGSTISTLLGAGTDAVTPTLAALYSADAWPSRVRLTWFAPQPLSAGVMVERMSSREGWRTIGAARKDGDRLIFEDDSVTPGGRYAYRLRGGPGNEPLTAEAWVDVPAETQLAFFGLAAGSGSAACQVAFSLATSEPSRLEVYDLAGRRLLARAIDDPEPGPHRIELAEAAAWKAGIYFARLSQGIRSARAKWCLLR